jgi:hypothetical protein
MAWGDDDGKTLDLCAPRAVQDTLEHLNIVACDSVQDARHAREAGGHHHAG